MRTVLTTRGLTVRERCVGDLPFIADMLAHSEVMAAWECVYDRDEALQWIERQRSRYVKDGFGYWLAFVRESSTPIGQIGLQAVTIDGKLEVGLGYMIYRPFRKQGDAHEGTRARIDWGFRQIACDRIIVLIPPMNVHSIRVAARLGLRATHKIENADITHVIYELPRAAWSNGGVLATDEYRAGSDPPQRVDDFRSHIVD